jgi:hypothetical protein
MKDYSDKLIDCERRASIMEANIVLAAQLLTEWVDPELDELGVQRLRTSTRSFLLNLPIGGRV